MAIYAGDNVTLSPNGAFAGLGKTITEYLWIYEGLAYTRLPASPNIVINSVGAGTKHAELKIKNSCGAISETKTVDFTVLEPFCPTPTLNGIIRSSELVYEGDSITFSPDGDFAGLGRTITEYLWTVNGLHNYTRLPVAPNLFVSGGVLEAGETYTVELRIKNSCGAISVAKSITFTVLAPFCPIPTLTGITVS